MTETKYHATETQIAILRKMSTGWLIIETTRNYIPGKEYNLYKPRSGKNECVRADTFRLLQINRLVRAKNIENKYTEWELTQQGKALAEQLIER